MILDPLLIGVCAVGFVASDAAVALFRRHRVNQREMAAKRVAEQKAKDEELARQYDLKHEAIHAANEASELSAMRRELQHLRMVRQPLVVQQSSTVRVRELEQELETLKATLAQRQPSAVTTFYVVRNQHTGWIDSVWPTPFEAALRAERSVTLTVETCTKGVVAPPPQNVNWSTLGTSPSPRFLSS